MNRFIEELSTDIDWRTREISSIRTLPFRYNMAESDKNILYTSIVPMLYSIWEGFVVNTFTLLTQHIERSSTNWRDLHINLLTHSLDTALPISSPITNFDKKLKFVQCLLSVYEDGVKLSPNIPTGSNVNYKVICCALERFNLPRLDVKYRTPLDRLLLFRNKISHGEMAIPVNSEIINEFSLTVINLIYDVFLVLEKNVEEKCYLNDAARQKLLAV